MSALSAIYDCIGVLMGLAIGALFVIAIFHAIMSKGGRR